VCDIEDADELRDSGMLATTQRQEEGAAAWQRRGHDEEVPGADAGPACELELTSMENTYMSGRERRIRSHNSMEKKGKRVESSPGVRAHARGGQG
jgi:hypothetical protein